MKTVTAALLLVFLSLSASASESVASLVETYDQPRLGTSGRVQNAEWSHGHLKVRFTEGSAAPVLAGDETIGIYFKGKGTYEYLSVDATEAAVLQTKAEKAGDGLVVRDSFESLFVWTRNAAAPAIEVAAGADLSGSFKDHRDLFGRDRHTVAPFVFAKAKLDAFGEPLVRAEFSGGRESAVYLYDPLLAHAEKLYTLHKYRDTSIREYQQALWPVVLSEQLIGHDRRQFVNPEFLLFGLDYTLTASGGNDATLSVVETIVPMGRPQRVFRFNQSSTFYDDNRKMRQFNVRKVTDAKGAALPFVHREGELLVGLPTAAPPDQPFELRFEIDGDFLYRPGGDSYWELGIAPWFPQPDLNGQYYTVHSTIKVKKPFVPFAPGVTVRRAEEGDYNVVENTIDKPVQFAVALAGKYAYSEETQDGLTIRIATYAGKNDLAMKKLSSLAFKIIKYYEPFLGPFPFKEFNIIEIREYGYGQAPPATMFITQEAFSPLKDTLNQIFSGGINHRFAHEIAHQYWGHAVKMGSMEEQWITESFSEYCSSFVVGEIKGKNGRQAMVNTWRANAKSASGASSIAMANRLVDYNDDRAWIDRTHLIYDKGAYVLSKLHDEVGDQAFFSFLRNFQAMKAWRFATTSEMAPLLQQLTKKDYAPFFEKHFWGTAMP
jgi:hypothetical protein